MSDVHPSDERLVDLALTDLDSRDQDALTAHLARCEACRLRYSVIADTVDGVLAAAPSVAPPPGFLSDVLAAMSLEPARSMAAKPVPAEAIAAAPVVDSAQLRPAEGLDPAPSAPEGAASRPTSMRRAYLLAAVAAVVALLAGALGTAFVLRSAAPPPDSVAGAPFVTAEGDTVGSVQTARYEGEGVLVVSVNGPPGATYDCRVERADGTQQTLASWTLPPDGEAAWVMDAPDGTVVRMDLVAPSGRVWASADL